MISDEEYDIIDEIYEEEIDYLDSNKENNQYVLGIGMIIKNGIFIAGVSNKTFFKYDLKNIISYLKCYSIIFVRNPTLNIFKLVIVDDVYIGIKKTFWISICQRHWKKIFREKKEIFSKRKRASSILHFQTYGFYPIGMRCMPSIRGMLNAYNNKQSPPLIQKH